MQASRKNCILPIYGQTDPQMAIVLSTFVCHKNLVTPNCIYSLDCSANVTLVGNGFCNDEVNHADCNFDFGECCVNINMDQCSDCTCHHQENCVAGFTPSVVGDGFCNDGSNNADCNFDGGDCCGSCVLNNQCTECACLGGADVINPLIGNWFCNDGLNNADCDYDGGDCCKSNAIP